MSISTSTKDILGRPSTAIPLMYVATAALWWAPLDMSFEVRSLILTPSLLFTMLTGELLIAKPFIVQLSVAYLLALTFWTTIGAVFDWRTLKQDLGFRRRFRNVILLSYILILFVCIVYGIVHRESLIVHYAE